MTNKYSHLHFVPYKNLGRWDIKNYISQGLSSQYKMVVLGDYIHEESTKYNISDKTKEYGILGVNNQTGIFDAYRENGAKIHQKYKRMKDGWIAYNPYRVNVGSIGIKLKAHKYEYISPAYVVFSCKKDLLPEYLFLLMKSQTFNRIIRDNTTGSVRQNLSYARLSSIQIPLPSLEEQKALVDVYNQHLVKAGQLEEKAIINDESIIAFVNDRLGLVKSQAQKKNDLTCLLRFINYRDTYERWDPFNANGSIHSKFPIVKLTKLITDISTGTTPPTSHKEFFNGDIKFYTPADIGKEMYLDATERTLAQPAVNAKKARLFHKGQLLFVGIGSTVGKIGIVSDKQVSSNQQITGFSINSSLATPEYVYCYMHCNKDITTAERTKTTLPVVNQAKIEQIPIPLPPLSVQQEIVDEVQKRRAQIASCRERAAKLRQDAIAQFEQAIFE